VKKERGGKATRPGLLELVVVGGSGVVTNDVVLAAVLEVTEDDDTTDKEDNKDDDGSDGNDNPEEPVASAGTTLVGGLDREIVVDGEREVVASLEGDVLGGGVSRGGELDGDGVVTLIEDLAGRGVGTVGDDSRDGVGAHKEARDDVLGGDGIISLEGKGDGGTSLALAELLDDDEGLSLVLDLSGRVEGLGVGDEGAEGVVLVADEGRSTDKGSEGAVDGLLALAISGDRDREETSGDVLIVGELVLLIEVNGGVLGALGSAGEAEVKVGVLVVVVVDTTDARGEGGGGRDGRRDGGGSGAD
jgi:hypothetical protein